jgi:predicted HD phosphohydrolase
MVTLSARAPSSSAAHGFQCAASAELAGGEPWLVDAAVEAWTGDLLPDNRYAARAKIRDHLCPLWPRRCDCRAPSMDVIS